MTKAKLAISIVAVVAGLVSAVLWWIGSTSEKKNLEAFIHWRLVDSSHGPFHVDTYPYLERIGWWNKWAAVATGVSVIASTIAGFL